MFDHVQQAVQLAFAQRPFSRRVFLRVQALQFALKFFYLLVNVRLIGEGICFHHQAVKALKQETVVHVGDSLFLEYQKFMKGHIGTFEVLESLLSAFRISWFMPRNVEIEIGYACVDAGRECLLECLAEKLA